MLKILDSAVDREEAAAARKPKDAPEDQDLHLAQNQHMAVMDHTGEDLAEEGEVKLAVEADKGAKWDLDETPWLQKTVKRWMLWVRTANQAQKPKGAERDLSAVEADEDEDLEGTGANLAVDVEEECKLGLASETSFTSLRTSQ